MKLHLYIGILVLVLMLSSANGMEHVQAIQKSAYEISQNEDTYEPDNTCNEAQPIAANGTIQLHSFHDYADEDWIFFEGEAGDTYEIEARVPLTSTADVRMELYDICSAQANTPQALYPSGPSARLKFVAPANATYYIRTYNNDPADYGADVRYYLDVRTMHPSPGAVILVAGRQRMDDPLQSNIHHVTNAAYRLFWAKGYPGERIYYLATDSTLDGDGDGDGDVDVTLSNANLEYAITQWAADKVGPDRPLTVYMMDHCIYDRFFLDGVNGEMVTPQEMSNWLSQLESTVADLEINVIIDASEAGSFIDLPQTVSAPGRVIIASTSAEGWAYTSQDGAFFSEVFLQKLGLDVDLWTAFAEAQELTTAIYPLQVPWLDDNGDGLANETEDGIEARSRFLFLPACYPLTNVSITGPSSGTVSNDLIFTIDISPTTASLPITYAWSDDGLIAGQGTAEATYHWNSTGNKTVEITTRNCAGRDFSDSQDVVISELSSEDDYEPDDTCVEASTLATDGSIQPHTFHDQSDADWVTFDAEAGATYVIQGSDVGPQVDLVPELHNSCSQPALPGDDLDFGQGFRLVWDCPATGTYYLKVFNRDTDVYGEEAYYDLSIREQSSEGVAIVVAGHRDVPETVMPNFTYAANMAYRVFLAGGYDHDHIYYLHPDSTTDADGDGTSDVDAVSSSANLQQAITGWAADWVGPSTPVYLYLVDHGGDDLFYIDTWSDTVSAAELNGWLTELENSTGCEEINVVLEACESGSFILPPDSLSRSGRVIISAAKARQTAYGPRNGQGAYFSNTFLAQLGGGADLWTAYATSRDALWELRAQLNYQQPWLDDNGDGVSDALDGDVARQRGLLSAFGRAVPWIATVSPAQQIDAYTAVITATIYDDEPLDEVWAEIYPPSYRPPDDPDSVQLIDVPQVRLTQTGAQTYRGTYGGFTEVGEYQVVVSARDDDQNHAVPQVTTVRTGWNVYLPLVLRAP